MSSLTVKINPAIVDVFFNKDDFHVVLADGRKISIPLEWFPLLKEADAQSRKKWRLIGNGIGIHWEDIDEDISIETLMRLQ